MSIKIPTNVGMKTAVMIATDAATIPTTNAASTQSQNAARVQRKLCVPKLVVMISISALKA